MTTTEPIDIVRALFAAKERHDLAAVVENFAEDIRYVFPLAADGEPHAWFTYTGVAEVTEYQRVTLERFAQIRMTDQTFYRVEDGETVFATSTGDYRTADDRSYTNVYVFRFIVRDGRITHVDEYANPITFARLAGLPFG